MPPAVTYIVNGARTPMADYGGALKDVSASELGVVASAAALARSGVDPAGVDHVVFGNVLQTAPDAIYAARHIGLRSGVPVTVPALLVNRLCGSGIEAAVVAAQRIRLGESQLVLCGGVESMTQAPHVIRGLRSGLRLGQGKLEDSLWEALTDTYCGAPMAMTAENCAARYGVSREDQDAFALRSQQAAARAWAEGRFADEVVPVPVTVRGSVVHVTRDDHVRPDTTLASLAALKPAFKRDGGVTAGNASGIVDGGAALVVAGERAVTALGLAPLARLTGWATVGVEPAFMGMGPAPAIREVLARAGLSLTDIDLFEINEAFAAQYLSVERELGLDRDRVNVNGGAIALGHPLGMSGTRLLLTLALEMRRRGARRGIASACIGGGQGIAALLEAA
jgi:acetyl-CoA acetyltransferase family protein